MSLEYRLAPESKEALKRGGKRLGLESGGQGMSLENHPVIRDGSMWQRDPFVVFPVIREGK